MNPNMFVSNHAEKIDIEPNEVKWLSEFVENKDDHLYGFTVTLKGGAIRNYFIRCELPTDFEK
jgi:hypothetical protein